MNSPGYKQRRIGLVSASTLVVANMIGVGVFTTSGFALADLKRPEVVLLAWAVGGLLALCGALSYGALARRIPESGGEYTYLSSVFHPLAGFLAGWVSLLAGFTAPIAAAGLGLGAYLGEFLGETANPKWIATGAILAAGLMHGLRLREGVTLQNALVATKLLLIAGLILTGVHLIDAKPDFTRTGFTAIEWTPFGVTLVWISFSYSGWNAAVYLGGEVRDPRRNLQRSLWLATTATTMVYLALNAVFLYSAPMEEIAGRAEIAAIAAEALGGPRLRDGVALLISLAVFTSISSMVMAGPRVYARMAEDGLFPRFFTAGPDVPTAGVAVQVSLSVLVVWATGLAELLSYIGFTLGLSASATVIALILLRRREGAQNIPVPGYPWVPGVFLVGTLAASGLMALGQPLQAGLGLLTVSIGIPVYRLMRRPGAGPPSRSHRRGDVC